jgi:hypothetical protein
MSRPLVQWGPVPDGVTPLVGYRMWTLSVRPGYRELRSLNGTVAFEVRLHDPLGKRAEPWLAARCLKDDHDAPQESCSCGFYAVKSLFTLGCLIPFARCSRARMADPRAFFVAGRVDLAGKVIEHDLGFRAERMRIAELLAFGRTEQTVARFARRLGVPVGEPISCPDFVAGPANVQGYAFPGHAAAVLRKLAAIRDKDSAPS